MTSPSRKITATLLAAAGLSSLSPMQQGAALLTAAGAALWASPALATNNIPGVGTIVKKNPGPGCLMSPGKDSSAEPSRTGCVIAPSDANGETRLTGLEPGTYSVRLVEGAEETMMKVGDDGKLAFVAYEDIKTAEPQRRKVQTKQLKAYRNGEQPVARRWAEQIAFDGNCDEPGKCPPWGNPRLALDLNSANADQLMRGTSNSPDTAKVIIADREKNGAFKGIEDFAQRVCPIADVDFSQTSIRMGDLVVILTPRAGDKGGVPGFQCTRADEGRFNLFGKKHNYVGHVTLLR
jgi:hypothetical protein